MFEAYFSADVCKTCPDDVVCIAAIACETGFVIVEKKSVYVTFRLQLTVANYSLL